VAPTFTVSGGGSNVKLSILTVASSARATGPIARSVDLTSAIASSGVPSACGGQCHNRQLAL